MTELRMDQGPRSQEGVRASDRRAGDLSHATPIAAPTDLAGATHRQSANGAPPTEQPGVPSAPPGGRQAATSSPGPGQRHERSQVSLPEESAAWSRPGPGHPAYEQLVAIAMDGLLMMATEDEGRERRGC